MTTSYITYILNMVNMKHQIASFLFATAPISDKAVAQSLQGYDALLNDTNNEEGVSSDDSEDECWDWRYLQQGVKF